MIEVDRIIADLNMMKERTALYIYPINTDSLFNFLYGMERCFLLSFDKSEIRSRFTEIRDSSLDATAQRGWRVSSMKPVAEMQEKGMSEEDIIQEFIEIDILKWMIWSQQLSDKT